MRTRFALLCFACVAFGAAALDAQTTSQKTTPAATPATDKSSSVASPAAVPSSYRNISLGSSMDGVKQALLEDPLFGYRGERDVSMLSGENRTLIETSGTAFITRAWFQFSDDKLYIMTFNLDAEKVDYFSIYSHLVEKYGEPVSMDPRKSIWTDGKATMSLERPLTLKYVDDEIFSKLLEKDTTGKASSDITRESFINDF